MGLKQNLVEHLHEYFSMKTLDHLEQPFADDQLDHFLVTLEGYHQVFNLKIKQAYRPNFIKCIRDIKESTPHIGGWVAIKA